MPLVLEKIESLVVDIVSHHMGVARDAISPATSFRNDLGADSLDTVEMTIEFEEEFDIVIPDDKMETLLTVGDVIGFVQEQLG